MKELLEAIAKAIVDNPDRVQVRAIEGGELSFLSCASIPATSGK